MYSNDPNQPYQQPPYNNPYQGPPQPPPKKAGIPTAVWVALLSVVGLCAVCCMGGAGWLAYIGMKGPQTYVVSGNQIKSHHMDTIRSLGLLESDEEIIQFYSDALVDVQNGMYMITDDRVILYSQNWSPPTIYIPFEAIEDFELDASESELLMDSFLTIYLKNGESHSFPVSAENGGDRRFVRALTQQAPQLNN